MRRRSEAQVLDVVRRQDVIDRMTLAAQVGLTPQAVSNVLARLGAAGIVDEVGVRRKGVGKPVTLYRLRDVSRQAIGIHVTRRGLRMVRIGLRGEVRGHLWFDLPPDFTPEAVLERIRGGTSELREEIFDEDGVLTGAGIGMVGPLDHRAGVVRDAYGLHGWHDVPLRDLAQSALEMPVMVDKDVSAAVAGQAWAMGQRAGDTALIMMDAGVGAGLWLRDAVFRGEHTNAGEFGHTVVDFRGPRCVCGRNGCLEVVHAAALARGDITAAAEIIAVGALNLVEILDVQHLVLTGADFQLHQEKYLAAVETALSRHRPAAAWRSVSVTPAEHGEQSVAAGAAAQVLQRRLFSPEVPWPPG